MADRGIGITLPIRLGQTGYFAQSFSVLTQVKSNFINLMMTRKGERVMQPDFGCDIHSFLFENMGEEFEAKIQEAIESATMKWMPFLLLKSIKIGTDTSNPNKILVQVDYNLRTDATITDSVVLVF